MILNVLLNIVKKNAKAISGSKIIVDIDESCFVKTKYGKSKQKYQ